MATHDDLPKRQVTPVPVPVLPASLIPQKRVLEDDHAPSVSSPLNPNPSSQPHDDMAVAARDKPARTKKESLKKRESKVGVGGAGGAGGSGGSNGLSLGVGGGADSSRATPDPKIKDRVPSEFSPLRFKLAPPKSSDFEPARGPIFTHHHDVPAPDGSILQFFETSEQ